HTRSKRDWSSDVCSSDLTPRPQPGNTRPRIFRIPQRQALINRLGFNNKGVDDLIRQVRRSGYEGVLGVNIGKNFDTPVERAVDEIGRASCRAGGEVRTAD